jgi:opacity protein-like surface antigen
MRLTHGKAAILVFLFLAAGPADAFAALEPGDRAFSTSIGFADSPSGDYQTHTALTLTLEYHKTSTAALRGTLGKFHLEGRDPGVPTGNADTETWFMAGSLLLTPRLATIHPYVMAGAGLYSVTESDLAGSSNSLELGVHWGVGLDVQILRNFALRGEGTWHYVSGDISSPIQTWAFGGRFIF